MNARVMSCSLDFMRTYIDQKFVKRVREKSRLWIVCFTSKTLRQNPRLSNNMYSLHCRRKEHHWETAITDTAETELEIGATEYSEH